MLSTRVKDQIERYATEYVNIENDKVVNKAEGDGNFFAALQ